VAASKAQVLKPVGFQYSQGIVTASYFKAADDPRWASDPAVKQFLADLAKYAPGADPTDPYSVYGWLVGQTIVQTLQKMTSPTRAAMLDAAKHLDFTPALMLPGISVKTDGESDPYPIEAMQIAQFSGQNFVLKGSVIQASSG
jgi:branched-chain amino acid transport system substrate-binding protein